MCRETISQPDGRFVRPRVWWGVLCLAFGFLLLTGFRRAELELPPAFAATGGEPLSVAGHNPRRWGKPLAFGEYRTVAVKEKAEFSWSASAFGVEGGFARQAYRLAVEGPRGAYWEVECRGRAVEAWRDGFTVELTDAFTPRLSCAIRDSAGDLSRFVLASDGRELRGWLEGGRGGSFSARSLHRLQGARWQQPEPVGYLIETSGGEPVAAVEILNRGRVWLTSSAAGGPTPAAVTALLLYKPDLTPQVD